MARTFRASNGGAIERSSAMRRGQPQQLGLGAILAAAAIALAGVATPLPAEAADPFLRRTATVTAVERVGPSVVNITTERTVRTRSPFGGLGLGRDPHFDNFFRRFFEPRVGSRQVQNLGSGVLIDAKGHVLTNAHVVAQADVIRVKLADGREYDAEAIGADPNNDLAVLRIETKDKLPWIAPGRSDDLLVGEPVIAIGNPFGLSNTVTTGVISALDRSIRTDQRVFHGFLQTDASINPGNSGGPLLNAEGTLIGVNTAIYGNAEGIGFAIPIDVASRIVNELIEHGEVTPVWIGVELQALDEKLRAALDLPKSVSGALVNRVHERSPAAAAGIARGDVLQRLEGQPIATPTAFYEVLGQVTQGQRTRLELWRNGKNRTVRPVAKALPAGRVEELSERLLGMRISPNPQGALVVQSVRSGSGAARLGIQAGDLILAVNGRALSGEDGLRTAVLGLRGKTRALVVVGRGRGRYHVTVPLG